MEWDNFVIIKNICHFIKDIEKSISPEKLSEEIISALSKSIVTKNKFTAWHSSAHCHTYDTCSQCKTLMILSTIAMILDFYKAKNAKPSTSLSSISPVIYKSEEIINRNSDVSHVDGCLLNSKTLNQSKDKKSEWFEKTIVSLFDKGICSLLVPLLQCHCHFISFAVKKTLIKGLQSNLFRMVTVLTEVDGVLTQSNINNGEIVDFLTQVITGKNMSRCIKDLTCKWIFDLDHALEFNIEKRSDLYLSTCTQKFNMIRLWICLLKYTSQNGNQIELPERFFIFCQKQLKNLSKSWNNQQTNQAGLLCTQFLKLVSCIFLFNSKFPDIVFQTSYFILEHSSTFVLNGFENALFDKTDFIGHCKKPKERDHISIKKYSSSLTKSVTLIILEATVIALQSNQDKRKVMQFLESLCNMIMYQEPLSDFQPTTEWLVFLFSDQDDKWIAALFHFLRIWRYIKSHGWHADHINQQPSSLLHVTKEINLKKEMFKDNFNRSHTELNSKITSHYLLEKISPHKFFIQFLTFIKFDHLVLADFLSSVETEFLQYFTSYLHDLEDDWIGFQDICEKIDSETTRDTRGGIVDKNGSHECMASTSHVPPHLNIDNSYKTKFSSISENHQIEAVRVNVPKKRKRSTSCGCKYKKSSFLNKSVSVKNSLRLVFYSDSSDTSISDSCDSSCEDADQISKLHLKMKEDESSDDSSEERPLGSESDQSTQSNYCETIKDKVMGVLIRLRFHIQRLCDNCLFPFNIQPLIKQLIACERYYDDIV